MFDRIYVSSDIGDNGLNETEYDNCRFINCNFNGSNLSDILFSNCEFVSCDLSISALRNTTFRDIKFLRCKMLGLHFETCNNLMFFADFENCILDHSCFLRMKLKKFKFHNCSLKETDFTEADLQMAVFEDCDLKNSVFENSNLEKADFRTSFNFNIDPEINKLRHARFSGSGLLGLLSKYQLEID